MKAYMYTCIFTPRNLFKSIKALSSKHFIDCIGNKYTFITFIQQIRVVITTL